MQGSRFLCLLFQRSSANHPVASCA
jgi:hypothetical protein